MEVNEVQLNGHNPSDPRTIDLKDCGTFEDDRREEPTKEDQTERTTKRAKEEQTGITTIAKEDQTERTTKRAKEDQTEQTERTTILKKVDGSLPPMDLSHR
jgi:hypothetical protein